MIRFDIISSIPDFFYGPLNTSIIKRAQDKKLVEIYVHNLRDYAYDKHKQIDDRPFGGEPGMVLKPEPFFECIEKLLSERDYQNIVFTSPQGIIFNQEISKRLSLEKNTIIVAGRYKGIDERVREKFATLDISIGNFILSGGEIAAVVIIDSIIRLIPGVLNDSESALNDSFMDGELLSAPVYTRPAEYRGMRVPEVLLSGNEKLIKEWKQKKSVEITENWKKINRME